MNIAMIIIAVHPGLGGWDTFNAHINNRLSDFYQYDKNRASAGFFCVELPGKGY